tara:strand:+ start:38 stop:262 length:225 start_codon:yes stop_codon:yes gene_type:complete
LAASLRGMVIEKETQKLNKEIKMNWIVSRIKEFSSWHGGIAIAAGFLLLTGFPLLKLAAYAAIAWGILSIIKKD